MLSPCSVCVCVCVCVQPLFSRCLTVCVCHLSVCVCLLLPAAVCLLSAKHSVCVSGCSTKDTQSVVTDVHITVNAWCHVPGSCRFIFNAMSPMSLQEMEMKKENAKGHFWDKVFCFVKWDYTESCEIVLLLSQYLPYIIHWNDAACHSSATTHIHACQNECVCLNSETMVTKPQIAASVLLYCQEAKKMCDSVSPLPVCHWEPNNAAA